VFRRLLGAFAVCCEIRKNPNRICGIYEPLLFAEVARKNFNGGELASLIFMAAEAPSKAVKV
jgi:hypothetical protein